eukprot:1173189-Rhodomonas_salina.2
MCGWYVLICVAGARVRESFRLGADSAAHRWLIRLHFAYMSVLACHAYTSVLLCHIVCLYVLHMCCLYARLLPGSRAAGWCQRAPRLGPGSALRAVRPPRASYCGLSLIHISEPTDRG